MNSFKLTLSGFREYIKQTYNWFCMTELRKGRIMLSLLFDIFVILPLVYMLIGMVSHFVILYPLIALAKILGLFESLEGEMRTMPLLVAVDVVFSMGLAIYIVFYWL